MLRKIIFLCFLCQIKSAINQITIDSYTPTLKRKMENKGQNWNNVPTEKQHEIIELAASQQDNGEYIDLILFTYIKNPNAKITTESVESNRLLFKE